MGISALTMRLVVLLLAVMLALVVGLPEPVAKSDRSNDDAWEEKDISELIRVNAKPACNDTPMPKMGVGYANCENGDEDSTTNADLAQPHPQCFDCPTCKGC